MSIWSYLWPFGRKPKATPEIPYVFTKPTPPPMRSGDAGLGIEQRSTPPRPTTARLAHEGMVDNLEEIAAAVTTAVSAIYQDSLTPSPAHQSPPGPVHNHNSHDTGYNHTHHHADTPVHVDVSPSSFDAGGGSVSTGC